LESLLPWAFRFFPFLLCDTVWYPLGIIGKKIKKNSTSALLWLKTSERGRRGGRGVGDSQNKSPHSFMVHISGITPLLRPYPSVKHWGKIYSVWRVHYIREYLSQKRILMLCVIHKREGNCEYTNCTSIRSTIYNYEVGIRTLPSYTSKSVLVHDMVLWDGWIPWVGDIPKKWGHTWLCIISSYAPYFENAPNLGLYTTHKEPSGSFLSI
jgi:hypothetical protein